MTPVGYTGLTKWYAERAGQWLGAGLAVTAGDRFTVAAPLGEARIVLTVGPINDLGNGDLHLHYAGRVTAGDVEQGVSGSYFVAVDDAAEREEVARMIAAETYARAWAVLTAHWRMER